MTNPPDLKLASDLRVAVSRLIKKLRKESPTGLQLSLTERSTMALLNQHSALLPNELASMEMITNQSMSQVLNHLLQLEYIIRTPSQTDKRKVNISLSLLGKTTLLQLRHERDEWLAKAIIETCSITEREVLKQAATILTKLVDFK